MCKILPVFLQLVNPLIGMLGNIGPIVTTIMDGIKGAYNAVVRPINIAFRILCKIATLGFGRCPDVLPYM